MGFVVLASLTAGSIRRVALDFGVFTVLAAPLVEFLVELSLPLLIEPLVVAIELLDLFLPPAGIMRIVRVRTIVPAAALLAVIALALALA